MFQFSYLFFSLHLLLFFSFEHFFSLFLHSFPSILLLYKPHFTLLHFKNCLPCILFYSLLNDFLTVYTLLVIQIVPYNTYLILSLMLSLPYLTSHYLTLPYSNSYTVTWWQFGKKTWQFEISLSLTHPVLAVVNCSLLKLLLCTNVSIARSVLTLCTRTCVFMSVLTCVYVFKRTNIEIARTYICMLQYW